MSGIGIEEIKAKFKTEFGPIADKFHFYNFDLMDQKNYQGDFIWKPGVYVFWSPECSVIKVGRHLTNALKRALEHIRDDTGGEMRSLETDPSARLLLFNVKDTKDKHWVAALEIFFELNLKPKIQSGRLG
ncbi:hypothetical protein ACFL4N_04110 [Thermodesulfobacteriota bacterium]